MGFETSNELFINDKNPPKWDRKKSYYEQDIHTLLYYEEEKRKCIHGITVGGYFIHPWLYFHINHFKTPIPIVDNFGNEQEIIMSPPLDDNFLYITESYQEAKEREKILFLFGTRGSTKSVAITSLTQWTTLTRPQGKFLIMGGSSPDLATISSLLETAYTDVNPAFFMPTIKKDWEHYTLFGIKESGGLNLKYSEVFITNIDQGKNKKSEGGAGLSPVGFVFDEFGKVSGKAALESAIPSFKTQHGWKVTPVLAGCVCAGTKVWNNKGELITIEDLKPEEGILGFDQKNGVVSKEEITYWQPPHEKMCFRITTERGWKLECSHDHPILKSKTGLKKAFFEETENLTTGDYIFVVVNIESSRVQKEKIKSVESIGLKPVYNLTAGTTNTYLANGIITHNTGGNVDLSKDAKELLTNPEAYNILPMNWDRLNRLVPEEFITWKGDKNGKFGTFFPGQMTYREKIPRIEKPLSYVVGIKSKKLDQIKVQTTNWEVGNKVIEDLISAHRDEDDKNRVRMYYPTELAHCFLTASINPFPKVLIQRRIDELKNNSMFGKKIEIYRENSLFKISFSDKIKAGLHYTNQVTDAPILLFGEFPEIIPNSYMFAGGVDDYKLDASKYTDSLGVGYVLKRRGLAPNEPCERIMAMIATRPNTQLDFHNELELMFEAWNAMVLIEGVDVMFLPHLRLKKKDSKILAPAVTFANKSGKPNLASQYGMYPSPENNSYRLKLVVELTKERFVMGLDALGNEIVKYGVDFIDDIDLLEEMLEYKVGGNFDRIDAYGYALVQAREMDKANLRPKPVVSYEKTEKKDYSQTINKAYTFDPRLRGKYR